ncbi:hypothetical protein JCGZ_23050 [Jatropha curcas]|uniref:Uncharacterized protein n=1 Tax=Jatropha curcas TaxID=180498 RepID=A0A067JSY5_JATCU|nr:hypothetical protein JCGZ_23050 [Jatropha curcas]
MRGCAVFIELDCPWPVLVSSLLVLVEAAFGRLASNIWEVANTGSRLTNTIWVKLPGYPFSLFLGFLAFRSPFEAQTTSHRVDSHAIGTVAEFPRIWCQNHD